MIIRTTLWAAIALAAIALAVQAYRTHRAPCPPVWVDVTWPDGAQESVLLELERGAAIFHATGDNGRAWSAWYEGDCNWRVIAQAGPCEYVEAAAHMHRGRLVCTPPTYPAEVPRYPEPEATP